MRNKKFKAYIRLTLTFTLIFAIIAATIFAVTVNLMDGKFFGYTFDSTKSETHLNALLLGVDKGGTRTDVIILAQLNLLDNSINMLQIPRDTYVANNGRSDRKINSAWGAGKEDKVFSEVYKVTGVEVDKYVLVDTSQFRNIIDTMGGVEFNVPINMNYDDPVQDLHIHLEKGLQTLNGDEAEQFVRFRQNNNGTGYARGDIERLEAQQGFIKAAIDQLFSISNVTRIPKLVSQFSSMIETNFTKAQMLNYAPSILKINRENINIMTLPGEGKYMNGGSYFVHYENQTKDLIKAYFTPDADKMSEDEMIIRNEVIGLSSTEVPADETIEAKKGFFNRFVTVDIIDASGGEADVDSIKESLAYYGYKVTATSSTSAFVNDKTQLVVSKSNKTGDKLAYALDMSSYIINEDKKNGTDVTIILGKDMS
ncbi:MAG: LCP family protein [Clostridia bacterium]|nr:LCP family protein [Clostridia bacterium]